jgi:tetratricopeptide (TPR) repeat protein
VVKQRTNNAEVHFNLANVLTELRRSDEARLEYASALRLQPDLFRKNLEVGKSLAGSGQLEAAQARFIAAIRLAPNDAEAHERLALVLAQQGKIEEAIGEFKEVVRLRPDAIAHYHIGLAQVMAGRFTEAIAAYREALRLNPEFPEALNDLAWILATHPQENFRNGSEAVRLAERAFELRREARYCGTLDAAYAEAGRFDEAIVNANKTRELALAAGQTEIAEAAEKRLTLYRSGKPFRQNPVSPREGGGSR